jgi:hypothetical protein
MFCTVSTGFHSSLQVPITSLNCSLHILDLFESRPNCCAIRLHSNMCTAHSLYMRSLLTAYALTFIVNIGFQLTRDYAEGGRLPVLSPDFIPLCTSHDINGRHVEFQHSLDSLEPHYCLALSVFTAYLLSMHCVLAGYLLPIHLEHLL